MNAGRRTQNWAGSGNGRIITTSQTSTQRLEFAALADAHGAAVLAMLRRLCGNSHDADDVFQETAERVWKSVGKSRPANPRAWLMTIAYRAFLDHAGRRTRHETIVDGADRRAETPDCAAQRGESVKRLNLAIARLPEAVRQVIVLHYKSGLSLRETAQVMEISEGTVKSRLNTALKHLRSLLE